MLFLLQTRGRLINRGLRILSTQIIHISPTSMPDLKANVSFLNLKNAALTAVKENPEGIRQADVAKKDYYQSGKFVVLEVPIC